MEDNLYEVNRITDDSLSELQSLLLSSFSLKTPIEAIKNKYDTQQFGVKNLGFLARSKTNESAAYYGVIPTRMTYNGIDYLIAQSGDTMTSPNHRKKGLFTQLASRTYELCEDEGVKIVFGFPNQNSFPGFKHKLNWFFTGHMQKLSLKAARLPFCEISIKIPSIRKAYLSYVKRVISRYIIDQSQLSLDSFNHSNGEGYIKKDRDFFNYKMNGDNVFIIRIKGFDLLVKIGRHLYIGEIGKIEEDRTDELLKTIVWLAKRLSCGRIVLSFSKNHWMYNLLKNKVTFSESLPIGFYRIDQTIDVHGIQFSQADYDTF